MYNGSGPVTVQRLVTMPLRPETQVCRTMERRACRLKATEGDEKTQAVLVDGKTERADMAAAQPLVLHVRSATGFGGGPDKTIINSPQFLRQLGYESVCAYMHAPADGQVLSSRARKAQAPFVSIPDRGPLDCRVLAQLVCICRQQKVCIWHGHEYKSNALGLLVRRFWPMKLVTTVHGWGVRAGRTWLYYRIDKWCLRHYDAVISVSEDLHRECVGLGVPDQRCHLIENAIDVKEFRCKLTREEARCRFEKGHRGLLLGAMGRLSPEKGFDLLIRAADRLLADGVDVTLWIAGEGDSRPQLETLIQQLGRSDRIHLLGQVADVKCFFQALDIFVLSSVREGLPNVLLEAMSLSVPVVATRVAGVPALVREGENGVLVAPGDMVELVAGIGRIAADADVRRRLALAGREAVERSYSFQQRMQRIGEIYEHVLGAGRSSQ